MLGWNRETRGRLAATFLTAENMKSRIGFFVVSSTVICLDQLTKLLVSWNLTLGDSLPVIPGLFHLTLVRNTGMAFGLLSAATIPYKPVLVTVLSLVALAAVAFYALHAPAGERLSRMGLAFILGGAAGNIIDRLRLGYVVDFLDVFYQGNHWPAFNVADAAICTGVGLLMLETVFRREHAEVAAEAGDP